MKKYKTKPRIEELEDTIKTCKKMMKKYEFGSDEYSSWASDLSHCRVQIYSIITTQEEILKIIKGMKVSGLDDTCKRLMLEELKNILVEDVGIRRTMIGTRKNENTNSV